MASRKFYRDPANGKIAGVCAGLADYFELDVTIVRIAFLIGLFCASFGLWPYLIIWAVVPKKEDSKVQYGD